LILPAWTDGKPFEPVLRDAAIEAGWKADSFPGKQRATSGDLQRQLAHLRAVVFR